MDQYPIRQNSPHYSKPDSRPQIGSAGVSDIQKPKLNAQENGENSKNDNIPDSFVPQQNEGFGRPNRPFDERMNPQQVNPKMKPMQPDLKKSSSTVEAPFVAQNTQQPMARKRHYQRETPEGNDIRDIYNHVP